MPLRLIKHIILCSFDGTPKIPTSKIKPGISILTCVLIQSKYRILG